MSLYNKLMDDMKAAMKSQDKGRLSVIRMLMSELKYAQAATNVHQSLSDDESLKVISRYQKKLTKSLEDYPSGDKKEAIEQEIKIVNEYLPQTLSEDQIRAVIKTVLNSTSERNFGALMKTVISQAGSGADGKMVSQLLKELINS